MVEHCIELDDQVVVLVAVFVALCVVFQLDQKNGFNIWFFKCYCLFLRHNIRQDPFDWPNNIQNLKTKKILLTSLYLFQPSLLFRNFPI